MKKILASAIVAVFLLTASFAAGQDKKPAEAVGPKGAERAVAAPTVAGHLTDILAGGTVGPYTSKMVMATSETKKEHQYNNKASDELTIDSTATTPVPVKAGQKIAFTCNYAVLTFSDKVFKVTEAREIYFGRTLCANLQVQVDRKGGAYQSVLSVLLPKTAKKGIYTVRYVVESEFSKDDREAVFTVE